VSRLIVTVKVQVVRFVQSSMAVQVTVVVPTGKGLPDGGEQDTATLASALSVAVGVENVTGTVEATPQIGALRRGGHSMTGGIVSCATVTRKLQVSRSPQRLVAVHVTVVVPRMNSAPDGGLHVITGAKLQLPPVGVGAG